MTSDIGVETDCVERELGFDISPEALSAILRFAEQHDLSVDATLEAFGLHIDQFGLDSDVRRPRGRRK